MRGISLASAGSPNRELELLKGVAAPQDNEPHPTPPEGKHALASPHHYREADTYGYTKPPHTKAITKRSPKREGDSA